MPLTCGNRRFMSPNLEDLRPLTEAEGPFLTLLLPAPSHHADAAERFAIRCKNALKNVSDEWPADDLDALESELLALPHEAGASVIVIRSADGVIHTEFIDDPVDASVFEGPFPRLAPLIEARQRTIAHLVIEADKAGASLMAFDGGEALASEIVEGDTDVIHRGHPGGWSQRRFQQRAENTWDENADGVADAAKVLAERVEARLIAVAGPARARSMVTDALHDRVRPEQCRIESVEAGDVDGIAEEVTRLTADVAAVDAVELIDAAKESMATADDFDGDVLAALEAGRVETLLVHDDGGTTNDDRIIDRGIARALATGAKIHVVPNVAALHGGLGAILRW